MTHDPDPYSYHSAYWVPEPFHPQGPPLMAPPAPRPRRRWLTGTGLVAAGAAVGMFAATSLHLGFSSTSTAQAPTIQGPTQQAPTQLPQLPGSGGGPTQRSSLATPAQQRGIVVIDSVLGYQSAVSAGTGMVLSADGEILTNNHVIDGATRIVVTVPSTGTKYAASVVGTAPSDDVAVLKLTNASGLQTATLDETPSPAVGDAVTAVGNAGGTGSLTAASGSISALNQTITASDGNGANAERLRGLIKVNAAIVSGDSGGPLYDSAGQVIGMDTAASQGNAGQVHGYAIPIDDALGVVAQIEKGRETSRIHIGARGMLGVTVVTGSNGAVVESVVNGSAAERTGILPGDVITAVDGKKISSATALTDAIHATSAGQHARVSWIDASGSERSADVTLGTGPAD